MEANNLISPENLRLIAENQNRRELSHRFPEVFYPWWRPCPVKVLLLTDGSFFRLDFGKGDFGLSSFVNMLLNDRRSYVKFEITLAHISDVPDQAVMKGEAGIVRSIKEFRFDNPDHFNSDLYDQIWLFGLSSGYAGGRLTQQELENINDFMNKGGGVFATGDHGTLGRALCGAIPRVRSMRLWNHTSNDPAVDEVSMRGRRRNDTNQRGHDTSWEFDDQSDDVPQTITPRLYTSRLSPFLKEAYPHPLLCSRYGIIDVMPDHPHEGECHEPFDYNQMDHLGQREYPYSGTILVRPEVIARSGVPAGNGDGTPGGKQLTQGHSFGSICAYDGHRVGVGRVVTDATWHHFVNVNLVGEINNSDPIKRQGFLASTQGGEHLDKIREYFINIGSWLARPNQQRCFNIRMLPFLLAQHRVIEAAVLQPELSVKDMPLNALYEIGTHARDVLGRKTSQCRKLQLIIDIGRRIFPEFLPWIDPWMTEIEKAADFISWVDPTPIINTAFGAGIVALRDEMEKAFPNQIGEVDDKFQRVFIDGARRGARLALEDFRKRLNDWSGLEITDHDGFLIRGYVFDAEQKPLAGIRVTAVDQDFSGENELGEAATTDRSGYFEIAYQASDFIIDGKESGGADIILRFYRGEELLRETAPYRNAESTLSVKITIE